MSSDCQDKVMQTKEGSAENKKGYRKYNIKKESVLPSVYCLNMDLGLSLDWFLNCSTKAFTSQHLEKNHRPPPHYQPLSIIRNKQVASLNKSTDISTKAFPSLAAPANESFVSYENSLQLGYEQGFPLLSLNTGTKQVSRKLFIQEVTECLQDSARRDLQFPLAKEDTWKVLVAEADLSRDEEAALRKALRQLLELPVVEDKERLQKELQDKKRFVEEFPQLEKKIEEKIRKLRALADHLDQVHKGCTISNVVTNTTSVVSGVLGILGLALAPVTAGGSLLLSATGLGLGAVATVTGVATVAVEEINKWSDEAKAKRLLSDTMDTKKKVPILKKIVHTLSRGFCNVFKQLETLRQNIRAIRVARANPHLVADAKLLMTAGRISAQQASQVKNVFKGTALAMTKKARIRGAAIAGVFLTVDVYYLVRESMHLYDGAKSESAKELRALAQELEDKVREIAKIHKTLQVS
ncbi:apolipoprotein L2-like [Microtus ochrogaster]|uniref:Apolipoprotein L2-like n=1 Tax=Microtus ochrogaster TaxID=79684 RepID=A0ABM1ALK0_MICOH|nr:apolipoprotein L2-like [Microtus ochrogaster]